MAVKVRTGSTSRWPPEAKATRGLDQQVAARGQGDARLEQRLDRRLDAFALERGLGVQVEGQAIERLGTRGQLGLGAGEARRIVDDDGVRRRLGGERRLEGILGRAQQGRRAALLRLGAQACRQAATGQPHALLRLRRPGHPHGDGVAFGQALGRLVERQQARAFAADIDEDGGQARIARRHPAQVEVVDQPRPVVAQHHQLGEFAIVEPGGAGLPGLRGDQQAPAHGCTPEGGPGGT